jgi:hypothetical protein
MWGNSHVRFGEREAGIRTAQAVDGAHVPTLLGNGTGHWVSLAQRGLL